MSPLPEPSPATSLFAFATQAYVTPVMLFDTSLSSNVIANATSEHVVSVPATPTGSG